MVGMGVFQAINLYRADMANSNKLRYLPTVFQKSSFLLIKIEITQ